MGHWEELRRGMQSRAISRRVFIERAIAVGATAAAAGRLFTDEAVADVTPKKGGHLVLGLNGASAGDTLDPANYTATHMQVFGSQLYDTLAEVDENVKLQPRLAESWEPKPGAAEWIVKIRKGVTFHDGKPMTAADVVHSYNHHRGKDSKSAAKELLAAFRDIKATDKYEVTITLDGGNADLPFILNDYHLCIGPEGSDFTDGIGTGPYMLEKIQPGVRGLTKLNPNKWDPNRGFVDSIETLAINDTTARLNALISGSVHIINRVDPKTVSLLKSRKDLQVLEIAGAAHYTFPMDCRVAPFNNADLRRAMKYAIDREAIVKTVLFGHGVVGNDHPIPSFDPNFADDLPKYTYDVDKAKFYWKKSGYSGPIVHTVSDGAFTGAVDAAQIFQASAAKAGIDIQLNKVPADGYWDNVWLKNPFCCSYWDGRPTADIMLTTVYQSTANWNESHWSNPQFDKLLVEARSELDQAKRKQMYRELELLVHDDCGVIIPMFNNTLDAASSKVKGFIPMATLQMSGYRAPEKVWLEG